MVSVQTLFMLTPEGSQSACFKKLSEVTATNTLIIDYLKG